MTEEDKKRTIDRLLGQLRRAWETESSRPRFRATYETWRERFPEIGRFPDVGDLISWFQAKEIDYEEINPVAIALSLLTQEGDQTASTLLLFLFIPGFGKALKELSEPATPEEVFTALLDGFTEAMLTMTPEVEQASGYLFDKGARGAAMSLRRDRVRQLGREWSLEKIAETNVAVLGMSDDLTDTDPGIKSEFDLINLAVEAKVLNEREAGFLTAQVMGEDIERIAQVLGMTVNAAYEMRRRMRQRLKDFIEDREVRARRNV